MTDINLSTSETDTNNDAVESNTAQKDSPMVHLSNVLRKSGDTKVKEETSELQDGNLNQESSQKANGESGENDTRTYGRNRRHTSKYSNNKTNSKVDRRNERVEEVIDEDNAEIINLDDFRSKTVEELLNFAVENGFDEHVSFAKQQNMVIMVLQELVLSKKNNGVDCIVKGSGVLELLPEGYGFLRFGKFSYSQRADDIYVSQNQVYKLHLRTGDRVECYVRLPKAREKFGTLALMKILSVNDTLFNERSKVTVFDDLRPIYPTEAIKLDASDKNKMDLSGRIIEFAVPLGKGQRALIVAPPRTGKTILLQKIANSITKNHPEIHLIVLLIGERPEEVTDMIDSVNAEVISSTFDEQYEKHLRTAEIVLERAKRLVEVGKDVVILADSITRLARAYNNHTPSSGKILSGGVDSNALQAPKRFFGAARNIDNGGSLTIIATTLVETGSRMDEVIFEEFKGTGNAEIILDRKLSDRRIFPAIDILRSGTRREELMIDANTLAKMHLIRKVILNMGSTEAMEFLIKKMKATNSNEDFFNSINSNISLG